MKNNNLLLLALIFFALALVLIGYLLNNTFPVNSSTVYYYPVFVESDTVLPTVTQIQTPTPISVNSAPFLGYSTPVPTEYIVELYLGRGEVMATPEYLFTVPTWEEVTQPTLEVVGNYDPSLYDEWHPWVEPTFANIIRLDYPGLLDDEIDRVYYGLAGTRTPIP